MVRFKDYLIREIKYFLTLQISSSITFFLSLLKGWTDNLSYGIESLLLVFGFCYKWSKRISFWIFQLNFICNCYMTRPQAYKALGVTGTSIQNENESQRQICCDRINTHSWYMTWFAVIWSLWLQRNHKVFQDKQVSPMEILDP